MSSVALKKSDLRKKKRDSVSKLASILGFFPRNSCGSLIKRNFCPFQEKDDAFYVVDLGDILLKHRKWVSQLPRVEPFYGTYLRSLSLHLRKYVDLCMALSKC